MCGIAGILAIDGHADGAGDSERRRQLVVSAMLSAISHRGPDEIGVFADDVVTLGHVRLSIIDLSGGSQPMFNEDRSCVLVYNGEVYDFQAIRQRLLGHHQFTTNTDSEVLLHLYEDNGASFCEQLNGMYAYSIWDSNAGLLQLAIDPVGIKPLYYYHDTQHFVFCSELRGMLAGLSALGVPLHWNRSALRSYLQLGWFPAPETAIHEVSKLLPGERLTVAGEQIERARTELPSATQLSDLPGDNTVDRLDRVLTEVVESQLVADVPVGVFLSGGVDSSLLTALAGKIQPGIKTFSVGFQGSSKEVASADESEVARQVAEHLGTEHHTFLVDPAGLLERLADAWTAMDEPIVDAAVLPLLIISQAAREHVKVCLSGDGGDEVFGGYPHHWLLGWKRRYHRSPRWVQGSLGRLASWLPQSPSRGIQERLRKAGVGYRLIAESDYSPGPFAPPHDVWLQEPGAFRELTLAQLCDDDWYFVDGLLHPLAGQMLPKSDRVSMFASIELRVPLLDNRMLAFGRGLSFSEKVHAGVTKAPLRQLLARYVPEAISRRPKHGFRVPLSGWFRDELKTDVAERLAGGAGIPDDVIAADAISRLVDEHASGRAEHSVRLWALMTLSDWMKRMGATATIN